MVSESLKKWDLERHVLKAIIFNARTPSKPTLPTIDEYILSEVINAAVEYTTGEEGTLNYTKHSHDLSYDQHFERVAWEYYQEQIRDTEKLATETREALDSLLEAHFINPGGPSSTYHKTHLQTDWRFGGVGICNVTMQSSFALDEQTLREMRTETVPSLPEPVRADCKQIGRLMQKYVQRDLKEISAHYHW